MFTEYADTANWLIRAFKDTGFTAERYSGADNHAERAAIQARFMDVPGSRSSSPLMRATRASTCK